MSSQFSSNRGLAYGTFEAVLTGSDPAAWSTQLDAFTRRAFMKGEAGSLLLGAVPLPLQAALLHGEWRPVGQDRWVRLHPLVTGTPAEVDERLCGVAQVHPEFTSLVQELQAGLRPGASPAALLMADRHLWPTKVVHDELFAFVVPVGVDWVRNVFGNEVTRRPPPPGSDSLSPGRHVQFMTGRLPPRLQPGARLLWAQRATGRGGRARVVGCSVLEEVQQGTAAELLRTLGDLPGPFRSEVQVLAGDPDARLTALVCTRGEGFTHEVGRAEAGRVGFTLGGGTTLSRRPERISSSQFAALYRCGVGQEAFLPASHG